MKRCSACHSQLVHQRIFHHGFTICLPCRSVGFTQSTLRWLVASEFIEALNQKKVKSVPPKDKSLKCFSCSQLMHSFQMRPGVERTENLRILPKIKYYEDFYRKGPLLLHLCPACGGSWMNARTLCQIPIPWEEHELNDSELKQAKARERDTGGASDPLETVALFFFGIPFIENTPSFSELPYYTYLTTIGVGVISYLAFKHHSLMEWLFLDPGRTGWELWRSMLTCSWVHANWRHYIGNMAGFLVFAPLVEHELDSETFLLLLGVSAVIASALQTFLIPSYLVGFSGVVSGVIAFFCLRFPTAVIGLSTSSVSVLRFSAPTALLMYVAMDLYELLLLLMKKGNIAGLAHLGGILTGYLFHMNTPDGNVTKAFKKMASQRLKRERDIKNWRSS